MKYFITVCLALLLCVVPVLGTPIGGAFPDSKLGAFTGPVSGTAQDDNVKASLDILHDRLNSISGGGSVFYVSSVIDGTTGLSRADAVGTFQEAVDLCTANSGDIIVGLAGHAENIASAAALDFDCAGITIICEGNGEDQPTISMITAATATAQISAADVFIFNLRFLGNFTNGITECLDITADGDGYGIVNCQFRETSATKELLIMITITAAADEGLIQGCQFIGIATGTDSVAIAMEGASDQTRIIANHFYGDWSDYVIKNAAASISMLIQDNVINNLDAGAGKLMTFHSSSTGSLINNKCYGNGATFALVGDAMFVSPDNVFMSTENVETRNFESMMGAFTGPAAGAAQDDNIKASLDLVNTDTEAILADTLSISGGALPAAPTSDSLASFIASGGVALGTELGNSVSIIDAIGSDGAALLDVAVGLAGIIGIPTDADNAVDSTNIASNADGSVFERLEYVQAFPGVDSATNFIGVDDAANLGLTTAVVPDHDGSVLERLEAIAAAQFGFNTANYLAVDTGVFDTTGTWSTQAKHEIATVTGLVKMLIIPQCTASVVTAGDAGSIELEDETTTASIIASSALGAGVMVTNELWVDATLTRTILTQTQLNAITIVVSELDIGYELTGAAATSGRIVFHIFWTPMSSTGAVVAGPGTPH